MWLIADLNKDPVVFSNVIGILFYDWFNPSISDIGA